MNLINQKMRPLYDFLENTSDKDRYSLAVITKSGFGKAPDTLCNHIHFLRTGHLSQFFGFKRSYKQVATDVADEVRIDWESCLNGRSWHELPEEDIENAIVKEMYGTCLDTLTQSDREKLLKISQLDEDILLRVPYCVFMAQLGPVGWAALFGHMTYWVFEATKWPELVAGICYISYIRHKKENETASD